MPLSYTVRTLVTFVLIVLAGLMVKGAQSPTSAATATLKGIVRENGISGKLMANTPATADGANPTESDSFGQFTLEFPPAPRRKQRDVAERQRVVLYAIVALIGLAIGLGLLGVMLWNAQLLVNLGLTGNYYYVVLLILGLAAAAFLFGVLQSSASYRGESGWGVLELGGPIVGAALAVLGGFYLVPNPTPFEITVLVHQPGGFVPKASGYLLIVIGTEVRRNEIGENGAVYLTDIPPSHRGETIPISIESSEFELAQSEQKYTLTGDRIQVEVKKKSGRISGRVEDEKGNPLSGATVRVAGLSKVTDSTAQFEIVIPGERLQLELDLEALAPGYPSKHFKVVPNGNAIVVSLDPTP